MTSSLNYGSETMSDFFEQDKQRITLAHSIVEASKKMPYLTLNNYAAVMSGVDAQTAIDEGHPDMREVSRFYEAITPIDMFGKEAVLKSGDKNEENLIGTIASFSREKFVPVLFEVIDDSFASQRWHGHMAIALAAKDKDVAAKFMPFRVNIEPGHRVVRGEPVPETLHYRPILSGFVQLEIDGETYGRL